MIVVSGFLEFRVKCFHSSKRHCWKNAVGWGDKLDRGEKKQKCLDFILLWTAARTGAFKTLMNSLLLFQSFHGEIAFGVVICFLVWAPASWRKCCLGNLQPIWKGRIWGASREGVFLNSCADSKNSGWNSRACCYWLCVWLTAGQEPGMLPSPEIFGCSHVALERWVWLKCLLEGIVMNPTETSIFLAPS